MYFKSKYTKAGSTLLAITLAGCTTVPKLPDSSEFPIEDITTDTTCWAATAIQKVTTSVKDRDENKPDPYLNDHPGSPNLPQFTGFDGRDWAIGITLNPKNTNQKTFGLGGKYSSSSAKNEDVLGGSLLGLPGGIAGVDSTGSTSGGQIYKFNGSILFDDRYKDFLKDCNPQNSRLEFKVTGLDFETWLRKVISPLGGKLMRYGTRSKEGAAPFTYRTILTVKYAGGVSTSFSSASGLWAGVGPSLSGQITHEIDLQISLAWNPQPAPTAIPNKKPNRGPTSLVAPQPYHTLSPTVSDGASRALDGATTLQILRDLNSQ